MAENFHTTRDAARLLGISLRTAQQWVEKGYLDGWKTKGGHRRITHSSVMRAMRKRDQDKEVHQRGHALPILIVEDDAALLKLYRIRASKWPFDVMLYTAPNGYEGLVMVGEKTPRLLICDLRLPGVSGFQIVRALCNMERYRDLTIVVVSGLSNDEIDAHGGMPNRVVMMSKPIDFTQLENIARNLIDEVTTPQSEIATT